MTQSALPTAVARPSMLQRKLDAQTLSQFSEGFEVRLNPDLPWIEKALDKVQARARTNRLSREQAADLYRRVVIGGESSACAGMQDCPMYLRYPISTTVMVMARLDDGLIACTIGRRQVVPGERGVPPVSADPTDEPRKWLHEVVAAFWACLDDECIERLRQSVTRSMTVAAAEMRSWRGRAAGRAEAKRKLQIERLLRCGKPAYVSELEESLLRIACELRGVGCREITWREFQHRWPSVASRYRRDLLQIFRQGKAEVDALTVAPNGASRYWLSFDTWAGAQTIFGGTQLVVQVCSTLLRAKRDDGSPSSETLRRQLRDKALQSTHPVSADTVGWLRVHLDDHHRLVFVDEVQSDVIEQLRESVHAGVDPAARSLLNDLEDWHLNGFASVTRWAALIGYRTATHSDASAATVDGKTRSARKWNLYYAALAKRVGMGLESFDGYPAPIRVEAHARSKEAPA